MACRIQKARFKTMALEEAAQLRLNMVEVDQEDPVERFDMVEVYQPPDRLTPHAVLNRKTIQSLVDEPEQARPIIRNLLRWAKEHGAR
jgi:hypothetical protein